MSGIPEAEPTVYDGIQMRSKLEAEWASVLDFYGIDWAYEPEVFRLASGALYLPDFWLPELGTFLEVKGIGIPRLWKAEQFAEEVNAEMIVLIGFPSQYRYLSYLRHQYPQWRDALGYDTRFAKCASCGGWQWLRPQVSRACRMCGISYEGFLARSGEIQFEQSEPVQILPWTEHA